MWKRHTIAVHPSSKEIKEFPILTHLCGLTWHFSLESVKKKNPWLGHMFEIRTFMQAYTDAFPFIKIMTQWLRHAGRMQTGVAQSAPKGTLRVRSVSVLGTVDHNLSVDPCGSGAWWCGGSCGKLRALSRDQRLLFLSGSVEFQGRQRRN